MRRDSAEFETPFSGAKLIVFIGVVSDVDMYSAQRLKWRGLENTSWPAILLARIRIEHLRHCDRDMASTNDGQAGVGKNTTSRLVLSASYVHGAVDSQTTIL